MSSRTPLVDGRQPLHSTVTEDVECLVCLRKPSDRNRMSGVVGCGNNPEYDEFMRRFIAYIVRTKGSRLSAER